MRGREGGCRPVQRSVSPRRSCRLPRDDPGVRVQDRQPERRRVLRLRQLRYDCDGDALVALVEPTGPACHTGERSCFYRELGDGERLPLAHEALPALERTLRSRAAERPEGSYTVKLLDDPKLIGEKVQEEAEEVARAGRDESDERVAEEAADLLYHLSVLLASREVPQSAVMEVLNGRRG